MKFFLLFYILIIYTSFTLAQSGASVKSFDCRPTIFINDKPEYPMIYTLTDVPGGRLTFEEMPQNNIKHMADAG